MEMSPVIDKATTAIVDTLGEKDSRLLLRYIQQIREFPNDLLYKIEKVYGSCPLNLWPGHVPPCDACGFMLESRCTAAEHTCPLFPDQIGLPPCDACEHGKSHKRCPYGSEPASVEVSHAAHSRGM